MPASSANAAPPAPQAFRSFLLEWQKNFCAQLEALEAKLFPEQEPAHFRFDAWERTGNSTGATDGTNTTDGGGRPAQQQQAQPQQGRQQQSQQGPRQQAQQPASGLQGGGISAVLRGGKLWEQAGVNFSHVRGAALPAAASANRPQLVGRSFEAMGVSIVIHPLNPYVPTTHANVRLLVAEAAPADSTGAGMASETATAEESAPVWWFGGGFDLTPYYGFEEDARHWHQTARAACQPFGDALYPKFKEWCDRYFYLPHRDEPRGLGGLFFDDYKADGDFNAAAAFARSVATHLIEGYAPIVERRAHTSYGEREREWQLYRRGRYVEFNLVCDRGTHFGLQSKGRTESILMSLPPLVRWEYDYHPQAGSPEAELLSRYLPPRQWA